MTGFGRKELGSSLSGVGKTTRAVVPSYTSATKAAERWLEENHLATPIDRDGTPWQIRIHLEIYKPESNAEPSSALIRSKKFSPHHRDLKLRLWAETTLSVEKLVQIGALDPKTDWRLIELAGPAEILVVLKEKVLIASDEEEAKMRYTAELPLFIDQIRATSALDVKKSLFCKQFDRSRVFGFHKTP